MTKQLVINASVVQNYLKENNYPPLVDYLNKVFKLERNEAGAPIPYELSCEVVALLHEILKTLIGDTINGSHKDIIRELFRSLRNYVINGDVQNYLIRSGDFLDDVVKLLNIQNESVFDVSSIILQFLINLIVSNKAGAVCVHDKFLKLICTLLKQKTCIYESSALLYNISLYKNLDLDSNVCNYILDLYEFESNVEFIQFLLETFLTYDYFWNYYNEIQLNKRMIILDIIREKQIKGESINISQHGLKTLTKHFINSAEIIFQTAISKKYGLEPYEVSLLLEVISSFCGQENYLKTLQGDKNLLINCGVFLINIHKLGKESQNCFTVIQSLSEIRQPPKTINEHPAFGFKAGLIRIIGNLCWKNKTMQDLSREAELIPVILDCCNMDARNPFIMQWVILAVRNLCEDNIENQKIIAEMHQEGVISSSVLEEFGLTLNSDSDNSLKIVPLEALKNKK